jgi:dihydropteroate synthase
MSPAMPHPDVPGALLPPLAQPRRTIGGRAFDFSRQVAVMAIVNRTPDSFFDRGRTFGLTAAIAAGRRAAADGADLVDIGGVKFAPGPAVPAAEEIDRVIPVVEGLRGCGAVLSVDTFRAEVALAAIAAGAAVINDTTALSDPDLADVVADSDATLVLTHSLARPRRPHPAPRYGDVVSEVARFLSERVEHALASGIPPERIVLDPGHDLNKNTLHSLELTRRLGEITALGLPVLVALSNKDFVGETLDRDVESRLPGTLAATTLCILQGARLVRAHDVVATVDAVRMTEAVLGFRSPAYLRHNMS